MEPGGLYPMQLLDVRLYTAMLERPSTEESVAGVETEDEQNVVNPFLGINVEVFRPTENNQVSVFLTLEIKGPDPKHPEFRLNFTLEGLFEAQVALDTIDAAVWEEFENTSAITLLWPYAREYTQSFTRRMRVDLPVLPTLHRLALQQMATTVSEPEA